MAFIDAASCIHIDFDIGICWKICSIVCSSCRRVPYYTFIVCHCKIIERALYTALGSIAQWSLIHLMELRGKSTQLAGSGCIVGCGPEGAK